jgi:hypothetical protein
MPLRRPPLHLLLSVQKWIRFAKTLVHLSQRKNGLFVCHRMIRSSVLLYADSHTHIPGVGELSYVRPQPSIVVPVNSPLSTLLLPSSFCTKLNSFCKDFGTPLPTKKLCPPLPPGYSFITRACSLAVTSLNLLESISFCKHTSRFQTELFRLKSKVILFYTYFQVQRVCREVALFV